MMCLKTWANEAQIFALEDAGSPKFCPGSLVFSGWRARRTCFWRHLGGDI